VKKQTIIVTGVSSGIGKEIARYFLEKGDNVVINSLNTEKLSQVFSELGGGENLAMVAGNVSDRITGIKLLATAIGKFGSADVLVNNAAIFKTRSFLNVDEAYLDWFLDINLKGAFFTTQAIIPQMLKQGHGVVINIAPPLVKEVVHSLTAQSAVEFGKHNIRFNTIALGTGMNSLNTGDETEDIARMVYVVAKSNFVNGSVINVSGSMAAGDSLNE
jgi:NAD(P)-dependent dehydrogenase (short-subunit alcohol dehydrogenase family)